MAVGCRSKNGWSAEASPRREIEWERTAIRVLDLTSQLTDLDAYGEMVLIDTEREARKVNPQK